MISKAQAIIEMANHPDPLIGIVMFVSMGVIIMIFMSLPRIIEYFRNKKVS